MAHIRFTYPEEFMDEIEILKQRGLMQQPIVRFTVLSRPTDTDPMSHLIAIATTVVGDNFLQMEICCGDIWGQEDNPQAQDRAKRIHGELRHRCEELGIEIRGGMFRSE